MTKKTICSKISKICDKHKCHKGCPLAVEDHRFDVVLFECRALQLMLTNERDELEKLVDDAFDKLEVRTNATPNK